MKASLARVTACGLSLALLATMGYPPFASAQPAPQDYQAAASYPPQQLDQLLAPIALYPDPLLAQILMAATYPLAVVEAARWVQDPNNAGLKADQLDAALQQQNWDPSVKSLVPFPQILQMMDSKLDWTQALGNAFLAQQAGVMDAVQRLRAEARAAGTLQSTPQETVSLQGQTIMIEPADPQVVYVPYYNPTVVYGSWDDPDYPPVYFPPPPHYGPAVGAGIYFGVGLGVVGALWGWNRWDWTRHDIHIDPDRYNRINDYAITHDHRPRYTANSWQHDPARRGGVPYGDPAVRQKFQPPVAGSAEGRRDFRGFDNRGGGPGPGAVSPGLAQTNSRVMAPSAPQRAAPPQAAAPRPAAPAFARFGNGPDVRAQSQRGQASRQTIAPVMRQPRPAQQQQQRSAPPRPQQHAAPGGGGGGGGGPRGGGGGGHERGHR